MGINSKYSTLALVAFTCSWNVSAQQSGFAFFYHVEFYMDTTDMDNKREEIMVLWTTSSQSLFQSYNGFRKDSVSKVYINLAKQRDKYGKTTSTSEFLKQSSEDQNRFAHPWFNYKILKSKEDGLIYSYQKIFRTDYVYSEALEGLKWEIGQGTKEIMGFSCQIASTQYGGREFVAWFTGDIPINDGPYTFNGLPGLILELYDSDCHYHFKLVGIENREANISDNLPTNVVKVKKERFFEIDKEFRVNPFSQMSEADANRFSPTSAASYRERARARNNKLELLVEK